MVILKTIVLSLRLLFHLMTFLPGQGEAITFYLTPIKNWAKRLFQGPQSLRIPSPITSAPSSHWVASTFFRKKLNVNMFLFADPTSTAATITPFNVTQG